MGCPEERAARGRGAQGLRGSHSQSTAKGRVWPWPQGIEPSLFWTPHTSSGSNPGLTSQIAPGRDGHSTAWAPLGVGTAQAPGPQVRGWMQQDKLQDKGPRSHMQTHRGVVGLPNLLVCPVPVHASSGVWKRPRLGEPMSSVPTAPIPAVTTQCQRPLCCYPTTPGAHGPPHTNQLGWRCGDMKSQNNLPHILLSGFHSTPTPATSCQLPAPLSQEAWRWSRHGPGQGKVRLPFPSPSLLQPLPASGPACPWLVQGAGGGALRAGSPTMRPECWE